MLVVKLLCQEGSHHCIISLSTEVSGVLWDLGQNCNKLLGLGVIHGSDGHAEKVNPVLLYSSRRRLGIEKYLRWR